ncbi:TldD/PmbA family protein [Eubacterium oxidoreducens]|uniref:TldD protein n=1 Tax=Eubacterium oxidoreducens TaxID=1732 RepID=A0A1G6CDN0_EUBOX|nr:TldD/PmbA family protein [Eubacterium oxidoreducens]SDB31008.1 TldD protein [Eubacterium oxidoreducens]
MIEEKIIQRVLEKAASTGADYAELFAERTSEHVMSMSGSKVDKMVDGVIAGVGIRVFKGVKSVYGSTSFMDEKSLMELATQVADAISQGGAVLDICLTPQLVVDHHLVEISPGEASKSDKLDLLKEAYFAAKEYHDVIDQVQGSFADKDRQILIANSDGLLTMDRQQRSRLRIEATASKKGEKQSGTFAPGSRMGLEFYQDMKPSYIGERAAKQALTLIDASYCPAGKMTVAIEHGFGGVIFHEACGHSLEASAVAIGQSGFAGKIGQQIAGEKVTAIDDGTIPNAWGSVNIDDEGTRTRRNVLIEHGVLKGYMVDKLNGRRMGMESTGSSRRENYCYAPTSRMTNTFIDNGPDRNEDIIASMDYGLYAKDMGGGSVNPVTGEFNFSVREGYIVRNGKICEPVRGASLIGKGTEILMNIDMVGQNLLRAQGMCGASSGSIPTDVGQPLIRVSSITVGGR